MFLLLICNENTCRGVAWIFAYQGGGAYYVDVYSVNLNGGGGDKGESREKAQPFPVALV